MGIFSKISSLFTGRRELDAATSESLSDALIAADIAPDLAEGLVGKLRAHGTISGPEAKQIMFDAMLPIVKKLEVRRAQSADVDSYKSKDKKTNSELSAYNSSALCALRTSLSKSPTVILVIGVNGAGKTTTIGKMAKQWTDSGKKVVIAAADTFRAAAGEQLAEWAARAGAELVGTPCQGVHGRAGSASLSDDPATVTYKAVEFGRENNADIIIIDTAGRLHNRADLMEELAKITRVIKKIIPDAPHETLLVLDANTGQNALNQIEYFGKVAALSGLVVTKMDSTAKGGFLVTYAANNKTRLPVYAIGYGEKIGDLSKFDAHEYLRKLLDM